MASKEPSYRPATAKDPFNAGGVRGYILAPFGALKKALGEPMKGESDDYKVSTAWRFVDPRDPRKQFTVYDYKINKKYDAQGFSLRDIRSKTRVIEWHIGSAASDTDFLVFAAWLSMKTGGAIRFYAP